MSPRFCGRCRCGARVPMTRRQYLSGALYTIVHDTYGRCSIRWAGDR